ncbi:MAG TPA: nitrilase-related carbon-nitrogen hydrolase [Plantibacter sp.]|uniref:nitrilase-related carbon-nitrogen hydrolase n=1 Tax=unclassified Plantibacter TaxID=2624265 RepID=UPI002B50C5C0|nr:nitrilase-related carbon-nitrogen hydrolase [Plantibacter sp.]
MSTFTLHTSDGVPASPARVEAGERTPLRIGVVQHAWHPHHETLVAQLDEAIGLAAEAGARIVFLPELTLSRYPADGLPTGRADVIAEPLLDGPTVQFARAAAARYGVLVHASLYESTGDADGRGLNTAVIVDPDGSVVARTSKLHIPVTAGYYEDRYFRAAPAAGREAIAGDVATDPYPVYAPQALGGARLGLPTCWDEWFPEVARAYALGGADLVVYPTAIGSEPDHPGFDTRPLWQHVIVGNGIANGLFMVAPNRIGSETRPDGTPGNTFYGSSFISDPYGRILAQAGRDEQAVLVADLELEQRQDWLTLFPFLRTRRPDTYAALVAPTGDDPVASPAVSPAMTGAAVSA